MKASNAQNSPVQPIPPSPCQLCHPITPVTPVNIVILVSVVTPNFLFRNRIVYLVLFGNDSISHFWDNKLRSAKVFVLNAGMSWSSKIGHNSPALAHSVHSTTSVGRLGVCVSVSCVPVCLFFFSCLFVLLSVCLCVRAPALVYSCTLDLLFGR